jgi:hypothetical protein
MKSVARTAAVAVATCAVAGGMLVGASPAAAAYAYPGQICAVNQNTWVRNTTTWNPMYTVTAGHAIRVTGWGPSGWLIGHGNGGADGYIPDDNRYYNCWTP